MHFVEIGPGATLGSFVRRIEKSATVYTADTAENIEKFLEVPR